MRERVRNGCKEKEREWLFVREGDKKKQKE